MANEAPKRVAVIGAGCSGLVSIKCCLEVGLIPVCFERSDDIGGLWRYRPETKDYTEASVMKSTVINASKEMMAFSDFPPPKEFPNFMHHEKIMDYFRMYTTHFNLWPYIKFNIEVILVKRASDYEKSGRCTVTYRECGKNEETTEEFDGVMLCSGHHSMPHYGHVSGLEDFSGNVVHSYKYKNTIGYEDKTVLVVGTGNSGGDIAVELSYTAKQVYLSSRSGIWINNRATVFGYPYDCVYLCRLGYWFYYAFPSLSHLVARTILTGNCDHQLYGIKPDVPPFRMHPFINDTLPSRMLAGRVCTKPDIAGCRKREVTFQDGTSVADIDVVILCTGFNIGFPYLEEGLIPVKNNAVRLYKNMYPTNLRHNTISVIGLVQPHGAILPISEMQARVFAHALNGQAVLPDRSEMDLDIDRIDQYNLNRFPKTQRHTIQVDYIILCDELAKLIGAEVPGPLRLLLKDPKLAFACYLGSGAPYQYRLYGPHSWKQARRHMLSVWDRIYYPLLPEASKNTKQPIGSLQVHKIVILGLTMLLCTIVVFISVIIRFVGA